jgi:hypothetical protein
MHSYNALSYRRAWPAPAREIGVHDNRKGGPQNHGGLNPPWRAIPRPPPGNSGWGVRNACGSAQRSIVSARRPYRLVWQYGIWPMHAAPPHTEWKKGGHADHPAIKPWGPDFRHQGKLNYRGIMNCFRKRPYKPSVFSAVRSTFGRAAENMPDPVMKHPNCRRHTRGCQGAVTGSSSPTPRPG